MGQIERNLETIRERIEASAKRAGRKPEEITLVAATKGVAPELIGEAISAGVRTVGENRVQEALAKYDEIGDSVQWHMIGHLQTNKVGKALDIFALIQSVDSWRLAEELSRRALSRGRVIDVLVEVNTSGEATKFGIEPDQVIPFLERTSLLHGIRVRGLMTMGLFSSDIEIVRSSFSRLRRLKDAIERKGLAEIEQLSMGMTSDFEVAIEEGSNMVRIGTGIFGVRGR